MGDLKWTLEKFIKESKEWLINNLNMIEDINE